MSYAWDMDVLANVLGVTQLGNTVLCQSELLPPWGMDVTQEKAAAIHVVLRGICWLRLEGEKKPIRLVSGDVVLVSGGTPHALLDDPRTRSEECPLAMARMRKRLAARTTPVPPAESSALLCAAYQFEQKGSHPLLALLPRLIHLQAGVAAGSEQLQLVTQLLLNEASRQPSGTELVVPRLVDSLLVFVVRAWLETQPRGMGGWFGALRDPQIGQALGLLHESPQHPWTVESLARKVGQSRAVFARRFADLVGEPPLTYLTRWRMNLAVKLLRTTNESVEDIAGRIGYESPTAFGKAFKRHLDSSPGQFRGGG